jgi:hypothetical protein
MPDIYRDNPNLKRANVQIEFTKKQIQEYQKCWDDPVYFTETYVKIVSLDEGLIPFKLYEFQRQMMWTFHTERFTICKLPRQSGKSTTIIAYLLHYALFNPTVSVAILANKAVTARDLLSRLQLAYEHLPDWLQQGVMTWNKGSLELENGSKILASSTSASAVRGGSYNIIFLDEFAYVPNNIAAQFLSSVYPTISSGKESKVMMVSTPNGMNMFYKLWNDAENGNNTYIPIEVHWSEVPGRDDEWREETIKNIGEEQFQTEFECSFLGSSNTLIHASKLGVLSHVTPLTSNAGLRVYEKPNPESSYVITVDVSRGVANDYSAFVVIDVSELPYKQVAVYRDNEIKPMHFPMIIYRVAKVYNFAYVMVEINDIGAQVADALQFDMEYDNMIMTTQHGRNGQIAGGGFSGKKAQLGVRTTKSLKKIGCSNLKTLVEDDKLIICDFDTIAELSSFVGKGQTWAGEDGNTDDLVMCLVLFSWLTDQTYFKELVDLDIRKQLWKEKADLVEQDMAPFGFVLDGVTNEHGEPIGENIDEFGSIWNPVVSSNREYLEDW